MRTGDLLEPLRQAFCAGWSIQNLGSWEAYRSSPGYPFWCTVHHCDAWECFTRRAPSDDPVKCPDD